MTKNYGLLTAKKPDRPRPTYDYVFETFTSKQIREFACANSLTLKDARKVLSTVIVDQAC